MCPSAYGFKRIFSDVCFVEVSVLCLCSGQDYDLKLSFINTGSSTETFSA